MRSNLEISNRLRPVQHTPPTPPTSRHLHPCSCSCPPLPAARAACTRMLRPKMTEFTLLAESGFIAADVWDVASQSHSTRRRVEWYQVRRLRLHGRTRAHAHAHRTAALPSPDAPLTPGQFSVAATAALKLKALRRTPPRPGQTHRPLCQHLRTPLTLRCSTEREIRLLALPPPSPSPGPRSYLPPSLHPP